MSHLTLHTGCQGDSTTVRVSWFDENNVAHEFELEVRVLPQDKPRTVQVLVQGVVVYTDPPASAEVYVLEPAKVTSELLRLLTVAMQDPAMRRVALVPIPTP